LVAARVAAKLRAEGHEVRLEHGKFGELRIELDGRDVYAGPRLGYSTPGRVLRAVRESIPRA
jgi:hypothetical protein